MVLSTLVRTVRKEPKFRQAENGGEQNLVTSLEGLTQNRETENGCS